MDESIFSSTNFDKNFFLKGLDKLIEEQKENPSLFIFTDEKIFIIKHKNTPEHLRKTFYFCKNTPKELKEKIINQQDLFLNFKVIYSDSELKDEIIMALTKVNLDFTESIIKPFVSVPKSSNIEFYTPMMFKSLKES